MTKKPCTCVSFFLFCQKSAPHRQLKGLILMKQEPHKYRKISGAYEHNSPNSLMTLIPFTTTDLDTLHADKNMF